MPRARCRRTVLRSSPTLRAMAETVSPCRFKSWIKTISPSVTTCASPPCVGAEVGMAAAAGFRRACLRKLAGGAQGWGVFIRHIWGGYDRRLQHARMPRQLAAFHGDKADAAGVEKLLRRILVEPELVPGLDAINPDCEPFLEDYAKKVAEKFSGPVRLRARPTTNFVKLQLSKPGQFRDREDLLSANVI